jgi:hypothetical protein
MGRLFWIAVGAGVAIYVMSKVRTYLDNANPEVIGNRVAESVTAGVRTAQDFVDRVRAATAESEAEIRSSLGLPQQQ